MALENISDFILLVFVTFSVPFYILFLLTILINRHKEPFNSSFFILCTSLGIADIAAVFHSYIFVKAPGWSWGHEFWVTYGYQGSFLAFYGSMMLWGISLAQHIGVLLIGINRFTAVVFTFKQAKIWSNRNIAIAIAVQWTVPVLFVAPSVNTDFVYDYWGGNGAGKYSNNANIDFGDATYEQAYYISAVLINLTVNVSTCSMYIAVLITALRVARKRNITPVGLFKGIRDTTKVNESVQSHNDVKLLAVPARPLGSQNRANSLAVPTKFPPVESCDRRSSDQGSYSTMEAMSKIKEKLFARRKTLDVANALGQKLAFERELRLAICGFLVFLSMLVYLIFLLGVALGTGDNFGWLWNIASDIFNCINPYTLFIMSKQTRAALKRTLMCRKI